LFKTKKYLKNIYYTCKPLLFVKNDKCVDKEYEEANEQGVVTKGWKCIFCWLRKTISHYGVGRPYYRTSGRTT
jgi:hypothetical protein